MSKARDELVSIVKENAYDGCSGGLSEYQYDDMCFEVADAISAAGYVKPRVITTMAELKKLPMLSVIHTRGEMVLERDSYGNHWSSTGSNFPHELSNDFLPALVLFIGPTA